MLSRLAPMILMLCALLTTEPATASPQSNLIQGPAVSTPEAASFHREIAVIWLYVVKEGRTVKQSFTSAELAQMSAITIDGYVNGIVLLSRAPLSVQVDHKPMNPIRSDADGYFKLKHFGDLSRQEFWSTYLSSELEGQMDTASTKGIQAFYSSFPRVPGDALSPLSEFPVTINNNGSAFHLTIHQDAPIRLNVCQLPDMDAPGPEFFYLGSELSRFEHPPEEFEARMQALMEGLQAVEISTGMQLVKRIHIIDWQGPRNAFTCQGENQIWLYTELFWNESIAELKSIAEHEAMHILSDRLKLSSNSRMRELFAEFKGFGLFSPERFFIVTTGRSPKGTHFGQDKANALFFDFINENNFINGMNGGHSEDNLDEFCASYLHSLIYIDQLARLLDQPVKSQNGTEMILADSDRRQLLDDYERVLAVVLRAISGQLPARLTALFQHGHAVTQQVELSAEPAQREAEPRS